MTSRGGHANKSPYIHPSAAMPTQPSIRPRSVNEHQIIPGLTPDHLR